jgi:uncharacterized membrane protein
MAIKRAVKSPKTRLESKDSTKDINDNLLITSMSYVYIFCLIPLLLRPDSKFAQFHAKQGVILFYLDSIAILFCWVPYFGGVLALLCFSLSAVATSKVASGKFTKIPIIYNLSLRFKLT